MNRAWTVAAAAMALACTLAAGCGSDVTAPPKGSLQVASAPSGAEVFVDGGPTWEVTPHTFTYFAEGAHTVRLHRPGFLDTTFSVTVRADSVTAVSIQLITRGAHPPLDPDSPGDVLANVAGGFASLDAAAYERQLAGEFVFRPQALDIPPGRPDSLTLDDEILFIRHLLVEGRPDVDLPAASHISITLTVLSEAPDTRLRRGGWVRCDVLAEMLVGLPDGREYLVSGREWLSMRTEPAGSSGRLAWRLGEWDDQPLEDAGRPPVRRAPGDKRATRWGELRLMWK
jgi:hypothetical protein